MNIKKLIWWIKVWIKDSLSCAGRVDLIVPFQMTEEQLVAIFAIVGIIVLSPLILLSLIIGLLAAPIRSAYYLYRYPQFAKQLYGEKP